MRILSILISAAILLSSEGEAQKYFTPDVEGIISAYGCGNCHPGSGGFDATSYSSVMTTGNHAPLVVAGDTNSTLVRKLKSTPPFGQRMPLGGPYLTEAEIRTIVEWIAGGAKQSAATGITAEGDRVPLTTALAPNYPNPFNPTTTIEYSVAGTARTSIQVIDLLGRVVTTLVNEERTPGTYRVTFDAAGLPSGIYFYRMQAGELTSTRRMIVAK